MFPGSYSHTAGSSYNIMFELYPDTKGTSSGEPTSEKFFRTFHFIIVIRRIRRIISMMSLSGKVSPQSQVNIRTKLELKVCMLIERKLS